MPAGDPLCPWCQGTGFLSEDLTRRRQPEDGEEGGVVNCPRCNPYGTSKPLTDLEMGDLVERERRSRS